MAEEAIGFLAEILVNISQNGNHFELEGKKEVKILVDGELVNVSPNNLVIA